MFSTRSPHRPNPIGLHRVEIVSIEEDKARLLVSNLEAVDGTPILDVKPMLSGGIGEDDQQVRGEPDVIEQEAPGFGW